MLGNVVPTCHFDVVSRSTKYFRGNLPLSHAMSNSCSMKLNKWLLFEKKTTFIEQYNISTNAVVAEAPSALGTDVEMQMTQRMDSDVRCHPDAQGSEVRGRCTRETNTRERDQGPPP